MITPFIAFDAKVLEVRKRHIGQRDVIALGSSITLNDLSSSVLTHNFHSSYYNFGSWAIGIADLDREISSYVAMYHPKFVVLPSNFPDFNQKPYDAIPGNIYLPTDVLPLYYFTNYTTFSQIASRRAELEDDMTSPARFDYLGFDAFGGVTLNVAPKYTSAVRRAEVNDLLKVFPTAHTAEAYNSLNNLAAFLKAKNIKLIFVQFPYTLHYITSVKKKELVAAHFITCKKIVETNGGLYIDLATDNNCPDNLFCDQIHLNAKGADLVTNELVKKLNGIIP